MRAKSNLNNHLNVTDKKIIQCIVELTSSAMVDAVKKGPFSLII